MSPGMNPFAVNNNDKEDDDDNDNNNNNNNNNNVIITIQSLFNTFNCRNKIMW